MKVILSWWHLDTCVTFHLNKLSSLLTDPCSAYEYFYVRYQAFEGTGCQKFCQCTPLATAADGTITYYWQRFFCAPGTLWDQHKLACVHAVGYTCSKYLQTITTNDIGLTCTEVKINEKEWLMTYTDI